MMPRLRIALILMVIFVACASYWKRSHRTASFGAPAQAESCSVDCVDTHATVSSMTTSPVDGRLMPILPIRVLSSANQAIVRECLSKDSSLPRVHLSDRLTMENILRDLGTISDSVMINLHVRRRDGREERLHVEPHDPSTKDAFQLAGQDFRVLDVDNEGLPIAKPFPPELKLDSMKHVVDSFVGDDAVAFRERRSHHTFSGGAASTVETDGRLTSLQLNFGRNVLGCAIQQNVLTCTCL